MSSFEIRSVVRSPVIVQKETGLKAERDTPRARKHARVRSGRAGIRVSAGGGRMVPSRRGMRSSSTRAKNTVADIAKRRRPERE